METHSEHLHKAPGQKFWHYFFEFFMLFLAVTSGFFVENLREHYVENERTIEYARQLITGLKNDTINLDEILVFQKNKLQAFDSLLFYFQQAEMTSEKWSGIYRHIDMIEQRRRFNPTTSTFDQISNSGALRYFKNRELVNQLLLYKHWIDLISIQDQIELQYIQDQINPFISKHFDRNQIRERFGTHIKRQGLGSARIGNLTPKKFLNDQPDLLFEFENIVIKAREVFLLPASSKETQLPKANELITLLAREYDVE